MNTLPDLLVNSDRMDQLYFSSLSAAFYLQGYGKSILTYGQKGFNWVSNWKKMGLDKNETFSPLHNMHNFILGWVNWVTLLYTM